MQFFDGVEAGPTAPQQANRSQKWLSVVMLVLNAFVAAEQCRQERLAARGDGSSTFEQVMTQAGLKIPGLEQTLAQLLGNGEVAKSVASMITDTPDQMKLLEHFAKHFGADATRTAASPAGDPRGPARAGKVGEQPAPPTSTSHGEAVSPAAQPLWERPDFERVAAEAVRAAELAAGTPPANDPLPSFRPDFGPEAPEAVRTPAGAPPAAPTRPSLVGVVRHHLNALRERMDTNEAELGARLTRAEAELAALRDDLRRRARPTLVVVPSSAEPTRAESADAQAEAPFAQSPPREPAERCVEQAVETPASSNVTPTTDGLSDGTDAPEAVAKPKETTSVPAVDLPSSASDEELAEALELVADFGAEVDARHQRSVTRLLAVEHETRTLRDTLRAEPIEPAVQSALS